MSEEGKKGISEVQEFTRQVLKKYGKYVKCVVMMGSAARNELKSSSDIDVFVVLDDATFNMTPELLQKIDEDFEVIAKKISERISLLQSFTLTEFWDYARICHPVVYNLIKEGIPTYDTGFFVPIKKLLEAGRIAGTREAIESYMEEAPKKIMRAKTIKLLIIAEDCYYAMLNTAQAVLMLMGVSPPVPSKAYEDVKKFLVEPGILEPEHAERLREIIEIRKKIGRKEITEVSGAFVDEWINNAEKFVEKMFSLLNMLETIKKEKILKATHEVMHKAVLEALKNLKKEPTSNDLSSIFKKEFIDTNLVDRHYWNVWKRVEELKKMADEKKITEINDKEVYELREHVRKLIHNLAKILKNKSRF